MRWITRLQEAPRDLDGPVVWLAEHAVAAGWRLPPPTAEDLADAARARRDGGGPRLLRRRLLRALAARACSVHPDALRFTRAASGAPGVESLAVHISAGGCEGWSIVALSPTPVGVDVEAADPNMPPEALVRWVLTEAYLKACGLGLATAPERVDLTPPDTASASWRVKLAAGQPARGCCFERPGLQAAAVILQL